MRWFCLKTNLQNAHKITRLYSLCADWVPCVFSSNFCWFDTAIYKWLCNELQTKFECRQKTERKMKRETVNWAVWQCETHWDRHIFTVEQITPTNDIFNSNKKTICLFHIKYLPQNLPVRTVCAFMKWNHIERQTRKWIEIIEQNHELQYSFCAEWIWLEVHFWYEILVGFSFHFNILTDFFDTK